jgi:hypothetical protein
VFGYTRISVVDKIGQSSHEYKTEGKTILFHILADTAGCNPDLLSPIEYNEWILDLAVVHARFVSLSFFIFPCNRHPAYTVESLCGI